MQSEPSPIIENPDLLLIHYIDHTSGQLANYWHIIKLLVWNSFEPLNDHSESVVVVPLTERTLPREHHMALFYFSLSPSWNRDNVLFERKGILDFSVNSL